MKKNLLATRLSRALAGALAIAAGSSAAQDAVPATPDGATRLDAIEVRGEIVYRDRAEEPATLV